MEQVIGDKALMRQIGRFGVVGGTCFLIDYLILIGLTELCGIDYLVSSGIAFTISVVVNYILSMRYVFESDPNCNKARECTLFIVLAVIGLGLNQLFMWLLVDVVGILYMFSKIVVTGIVMVYNFVTRKILLERKD